MSIQSQTNRPYRAFIFRPLEEVVVNGDSAPISQRLLDAIFTLRYKANIVRSPQITVAQNSHIGPLDQSNLSTMLQNLSAANTGPWIRIPMSPLILNLSGSTTALALGLGDAQSHQLYRTEASATGSEHWRELNGKVSHKPHCTLAETANNGQAIPIAPDITIAASFGDLSCRLYRKDDGNQKTDLFLGAVTDAVDFSRDL